MSNMSYCRHENTAADLAEVIDMWYDGAESKEEAKARRYLVKLAKEIVKLYEQDTETVDDLVVATSEDDA